MKEELYTDEINTISSSDEDDTVYQNKEQRPPIFTSTIQECLCCLMLTFSPAAAAMSAACFQTAITDISKYFNISGGSLTWSVSTVTLGNGSCLLLMGAIADAFGRKNALLIGYLGFALFAFLGGFAPNYPALCILRALQGMMVACSTPASVGFLGAAYKDSKRKNIVMSCFTIGAPAGSAFGYFLAGVFVQLYNWKGIHFFLGALFLLLSVGVYFFMPNDFELDRTTALTIFKKLDYFGASLSICGFALICFALTQAGNASKGWKTVYIPITLVLGVCCLVGFGLYEKFESPNPLIPLKLFHNKNFMLCLAITFLCWIVFFGVINYNAVMYFEQIKKDSIIITACYFLAQPVFGSIVNVVVGLTMHIIPGKLFVSIGCLGFLVFSIIWCTNGIDRNFFLGPFWGFCFAVLGSVIIYNISTRSTLSSVDKSLQSRAAATYNMILQLSCSIGLALSSTIISAKDPYYGKSANISHPLELFQAMKYTYYFAIALSSFSLGLCTFLSIGITGGKNNKNV